MIRCFGCLAQDIVQVAFGYSNNTRLKTLSRHSTPISDIIQVAQGYSINTRLKPNVSYFSVSLPYVVNAKSEQRPPVQSMKMEMSDSDIAPRIMPYGEKVQQYTLHRQAMTILAIVHRTTPFSNFGESLMKVIHL